MKTKFHLSLGTAALLCHCAMFAQTSVLTQHNDIGRTGLNPTETVLTPTNVSAAGSFGKLYTVPLDGRTFTQPLYVPSLTINGATHNVAFVGTTHDSVYALDTQANGAVLWKASLLDSAHGAAAGAIPDPQSDTGCADEDNPEYGITGTPVIDASTGTVILKGVVLHVATVPVRYPQGSQHGFLALRTQADKRIATRDVTQEVHGDVVKSRLMFHYRNGAVDDDTTLFSQHGVFRLMSDHHIQRGPSFPKASDVFIDAIHWQVTSRDENGKVRQDQMDLPADLANGRPPNLLLTIDPSASEIDISYLLPTPEPRFVRVTIKPAGTVPYKTRGTKREAIDYALHMALGGLPGVYRTTCRQAAP